MKTIVIKKLQNGHQSRAGARKIGPPKIVESPYSDCILTHLIRCMISLYVKMKSPEYVVIF